MRIITGSARGANLITLDGDSTRPTSARVKEGIFSAIQFELADRKVLDLFGGCGQLALEALSRGAQNATIVDVSREACAVIKENAEKTKLMPKCRIICSEWKEFLKSTKEKFDLVFLDPPYKEGVLDEILKKIGEENILAEHAIVVCESARNDVPVPPDGAVAKGYGYSHTAITILRY